MPSRLQPSNLDPTSRPSSGNTPQPLRKSVPSNGKLTGKLPIIEGSTREPDTRLTLVPPRAEPESWVITCATCHGTGKTSIPNQNALPVARFDCSSCEGLGYFCRACHSMGFVRHNGKANPCTHCPTYQRNLCTRMSKYTRVPMNLVATHASFASFPPQMDQKAIATMQEYVRYIQAGRDPHKDDLRRGVLLRGPNQIGKTGLAYCTHAELLGANVPSVFLRSADMLNIIQEAMMDENDPHAYGRALRNFSQITHLALDDVGSEALTDKRSEHLLTVLDARITTPWTFTTITTNLSLSTLTAEQELAQTNQMEATLGSRIYSRLVHKSMIKLLVEGGKMNLSHDDEEEGW